VPATFERFLTADLALSRDAVGETPLQPGLDGPLQLGHGLQRPDSGWRGGRIRILHFEADPLVSTDATPYGKVAISPAWVTRFAVTTVATKGNLYYGLRRSLWTRS
jgi:hypothetical protein